MASFTLHQHLQFLEEYSRLEPLPPCITDNLAPRFVLRPYQEQALRYFATYFQNDRLRQSTSRLLFHMATGSGKTAVMAGLILYLYEQGYRNFLFFVSLSNIVDQTRRIFLDPGSPKALFREQVLISGRPVAVRQVSNFQDCDPQAINLVFITTQGLHAMRDPRENSLSLDDFGAQPTVLISDEAHHLGAATKKGLTELEELQRTWEHTVDTVLAAHPDSLLLQFTATADNSTSELRAQNEARTIVEYPLSHFREDGYSKEIKTLRTDVSVMDRALLAIVLSQYRLKLFQSRRLNIKPVVLFKALSVKDSQAFQAQFIQTVERLDGGEVERLAALTSSPVLARAFRFFRDSGVSPQQLALELREEFGEKRCISANDDGEAAGRQLILNSLEAPDNPYRAVFEVRKLDEGWDVLNLFDIVRLYETRQSGGGRVSSATVAEAQLIGRGARYCPFRLREEDDPFRRKLDQDLDNPLRLCEELYYHCQNEHRYITELTSALRQTGIVPDTAVECLLTLRDSFRSSALYRKGWVCVNERLLLERTQGTALPPSLRGAVFDLTFHSGASGEDTVLDQRSREDRTAPARVLSVTLAQLASWNYSVLLHAMGPYEVFRFDRLKRRLPALRSVRQLVTDPACLGNVQLHITTTLDRLTPALAREACAQVMEQLAKSLQAWEERWLGSSRFSPVPMRELFTDKLVRYTDPAGDSAGIPQGLTADPELRLDLSREEWYAYTENFGTPEEKALVRELRAYLPLLEAQFAQVLLIRNERQLALYDFDQGRRFEPDYLLLLVRPGLQVQVFLEPKGDGFAEGDRWKEDFLLRLADSVPPAVLPDGIQCHVAGFHFFSRGSRELLRRDVEALLARYTPPSEKI